MSDSHALVRNALGAFAATVLALAPAAAGAATRLAVLTPSAPWSARCAAPAKERAAQLEERCTVLETLADEVRAGALAALDGRDVDVMTRENTAQLLKEMGAGAACTEGECEVETAKLIGADFVVSGNVVLVEGTWFVTMKVHAVKTAKLLKASDKVKGRSQVEIIDAVRSVAEALVRGALASGRAPAVADRGTDGRPKGTPVSPAAPEAVPPLPAGGAGAISLAADPDVLVAYDAALKADQAGADAPDRAAAAWKALAALAGENPYRALAEERCTRWGEFAKRREELLKRRTLDLERLQKVLPLEAIAMDQKRQLVDRFATAYGPGTLVPLIAKGPPEAFAALCPSLLVNVTVRVVDARGAAVNGPVSADGVALGTSPVSARLSVCTRKLSGTEVATGEVWQEDVAARFTAPGRGLKDEPPEVLIVAKLKGSTLTGTWLIDRDSSYIPRTDDHNGGRLTIEQHGDEIVARRWDRDRLGTYAVTQDVKFRGKRDGNRLVGKINVRQDDCGKHDLWIDSKGDAYPDGRRINLSSGYLTFESGMFSNCNETLHTTGNETWVRYDGE